MDIGVAVIDRYTYYNLEFLEKNVDINSQHTMKDLFDSYDRNLIHSTPGVRADLFRRRLDEVKITDFFGNVQSIEIGGQDETISEELLSRQPVPSANTTVPRNDSEAVIKRGPLDVGSHGYEVKLQQGNFWAKSGVVLICIILWVVSKQLQ
jgi:GPI-anchor transamidase subunit K